MKSVYISFLIVVVLFISSCNKENESPRTVRWSGITYVLPPNDTTSGTKYPEFHLGYFIELSDTGTCKLIRREHFRSELKAFEIMISDSLKTEIFELLTDSNLYVKQTPRSLSDDYIYDGFLYYIEYLTDTLSKNVYFIPPNSYSNQHKIYKIFESIWRNPSIVDTIDFNIPKLENELDKKHEKTYGKLPPIEIRTDIKFTI